MMVTRRERPLPPNRHNQESTGNKQRSRKHDLSRKAECQRTQKAIFKYIKVVIKGLHLMRTEQGIMN